MHQFRSKKRICSQIGEVISNSISLKERKDKLGRGSSTVRSREVLRKGVNSGRFKEPVILEPKNTHAFHDGRWDLAKRSGV